jgi:hypothetical protein
MVAGIGTSAIRVAAVVPAVLLVLFAGILWLLGLPCGKDRRAYVITLSKQAMDTVGTLLHGPLEPPPPRGTGTGRYRAVAPRRV